MHITPFIFPLVGVGVGSLVRGMYYRSFTNKERCHDLGPFSKVSSFCETLLNKSNNKSNSFRDFCFLVLSTEMIPIAIATIEESGKLLHSHTLRDNLLSSGVFFVKASTWVVGYTILATLVTGDVIQGPKKYISRNSSVDPSGHAIIVCWNVALRFHALRIIAELGVNSYSYKAFTVLMAVAETIWIYDTTVNYHSIVDVVSGCALGIFSMGAFDYACSSLVRLYHHIRPLVLTKFQKSSVL